MSTRSMRFEHAPVTVRVPFAASSAAAARRELHSWMRDQGFSRDVMDDSRVILSELVGNSVRHAQPLSDGTILISWRHDKGGIRLSVSDGGSSTRPRALKPSTTAVSGRGMAIVEALADKWWAERTRTRSTIHALLKG